MLEVSESTLAQYVVHYVGDTTLFGEEAYSQPEVLLEAAFTQLAFNKMDFEQQYEFFHETDIGLNEVYTYVKRFFQILITSIHNQSISLHIYTVHLSILTLKRESYLSVYLIIA